MIAEASIIWMFLNSHNLDTIISFFSNTRKYFLAEFVICAHFFLLLCHSDMTFINQQRIRVGLKCFLLEFIGVLRSPDLCTEYFGLFILYHTCSPRRNTFALSAFPIYIQFVEIAMMNGIRRQVDFPNTILLFFQLVGSFFLPIIKCTHHINMSSIRSPFTESPPLIGAMQSKIKIPRCKI